MLEASAVFNAFSNNSERASFPIDFSEHRYQFYDDLRSNSPVCWMPLDTEPAWFITGYKDAADILKDARFSKRIAAPKGFAFSKIQKNMMLFSNPPSHSRFRESVAKPFAEQIEKLKPRIQAISDHLLESFHQFPQVDLISDFAFPLTVTVISELLKIPPDNTNRFRLWANSVIRSIDLNRTNQTMREGAKAVLEMSEYLLHLIQRRRTNPKDDLISALLSVSSREQGAVLNDEEILATCVLFLIAGHETTVNLIGNGVLSLLLNPDQLKLLRECPQLIGNAVEEFLRYESPTQVTVRFASEDVPIGGETIYAGQQVNILLGAANRDPKQFSNPRQLDICRKPNRHLAFGAGIHACLGAGLARMEGQTAILSLLQKYPNLHLVSDEPQWRDCIGFRELTKLSVSMS